MSDNNSGVELQFSETAGSLIKRKAREKGAIRVYTKADDNEKADAMRHISRRRLMYQSVLLAALSVASGGCVPLLGLVLRGGLGRAFVRGARRGGPFSLSTLGRGVAVGARSASIARFTVPNTRIISPQGQVFGRTQAVGDNVALMVENRQIFYSERVPGVFRHFDRNGRRVGQSVEVSENRIDYIDEEERRIGHDILINGGRLVRQYDRFNDLIGETDVIVSEHQAEIVADLGTQAYIETLYDDPIFRCEEVGRAYDEYRAAQQACGNGDATACARLAGLRIRYFELRNIGC